MVRRPFKTELNSTKISKNKKQNNEVIATNIIKEIPLNDPPNGKMNHLNCKSEDAYEFSDQVSNKMGEMILQGYKMLDEICSTCGNVLLANQHKEKGCVACAMLLAKEMEISDKANGIDSKESNAIEMKKTNIIIEESRKIGETIKLPKKSLSDKISSKMGDLLVKGHTMLDEYCTVCSGILMKDPQTSVKNCIACQITNTQPAALLEKGITNDLSKTNNQGSNCELVVKNKAVVERLQHTSSIVGDTTLPISPQDILINLEIIKECLNILKEYNVKI
ncbi:Sjoegren syndrome/scleroderma autoantigen 1 family-containing protein [Strongyloides ratti]|uniref:Sjoegren syndrome/scleroderma autoantigen 1 family-containing protein n=1 Tax=Strongyloides ratti TaxID=34506 RepID=A0A090MXS6_STRRB|nr:Sjoegren syndrome/scleroderma autoantigen 1 family-containing protein [Strongyloides ratti]CEF65949.1 Sjoegren syndrome/scleroderma autoantigen 1 family-containing protein [Strongyloides ratti]